MKTLPALVLALWITVSPAQKEDAPANDPDAVIEATIDRPTDERMANRLSGIYAELDALKALQVEVNEGVITVSGEVAKEAAAASALRLANRIEGAVTVEDKIERSLDLEQNLTPKLEKFGADLKKLMRALPLLLLALLSAIAVALVGHILAKWRGLWSKLAPSPFLTELIGQAVRVTFIVIGIIVGLNLLDATALIGTVLGGAGVIGLAIGFAVRDTMENYISSIMLSIRQPFRSNDLVMVGSEEGIVVRLTSRATILMTRDGNHLRIPNSTVFKSVILNYTRNPERRFTYDLGVDAEDDPLAAMEEGVAAMKTLPFLLSDPKPKAIIDTVGDSNIVLNFAGWIDQSETDFATARSLAIRATKDALEAAGFTLPEPIYRLRFDKAVPALAGMAGATVEQAANPPEPITAPRETDNSAIDTRPETHLEEKVAEERAQTDDADLLDSQRPIE